MATPGRRRPDGADPPVLHGRLVPHGQREFRQRLHPLGGPAQGHAGQLGHQHDGHHRHPGQLPGLGPGAARKRPLLHRPDAQALGQGQRHGLHHRLHQRGPHLYLHGHRGRVAQGHPGLDGLPLDPGREHQPQQRPRSDRHRSHRHRLAGQRLLGWCLGDGRLGRPPEHAGAGAPLRPGRGRLHRHRALLQRAQRPAALRAGGHRQRRRGWHAAAYAGHRLLRRLRDGHGLDGQSARHGHGDHGPVAAGRPGDHHLQRHQAARHHGFRGQRPGDRPPRQERRRATSTSTAA